MSRVYCEVPPSLLLLSRTLYLPMEVSFTDRLKQIFATLPEEVAQETQLKISEIETGKVCSILPSLLVSFTRQGEVAAGLREATGAGEAGPGGAGGGAGGPEGGGGEGQGAVPSRGPRLRSARHPPGRRPLALRGKPSHSMFHREHKIGAFDGLDKGCGVRLKSSQVFIGQRSSQRKQIVRELTVECVLPFVVVCNCALRTTVGFR